MAEVLAAFSLATDLGVGKSMGHALRACYLGMEMARELRLSTLQLSPHAFRLCRAVIGNGAGHQRR